MPFNFFSIRAMDPEPDQTEFNRFLASHRVATIRWRWAARVEVASGAAPWRRTG